MCSGDGPLASDNNMKPTLEQQAVVDANGKVIKAVAFAGAGKTSTFVERAKAHNKRTLYLCFNKSVQMEAEKRFPGHVTCKTQHGLAYQAIITRRGYNGIRYSNVGKLFLKPTAQRFRIDYYMVSLVHKTVENFCNSADNELTIAHAQPDVIGRYTYDVSETVVNFARQLWELMISGNDQKDFPMTHGGYLKLFQLSKPRLGYEVVMLDEAQDTNPVVHDIVLSQADYGSQIILTGDPYQQIYAWRGAVDALNKVKADTYYMTQSFRFGPEVAGVANHLLNTFFNEERALVGLGHAGVISGLNQHNVRDAHGMGADSLPETYTFLARTNAYLFAEASRRAGTCKMYVPGSGQNGELPIFQAVLDVFALYQNRKFDIKGDYDLRHFDDYWQFLDFVKTGMADPEWTISAAMIEKYREGIPHQIEKIRQSLVSRPEDAQVMLVTAHRAKGMEWDNVVLGNDYAELFGEDGSIRQLGDDRKTQVKHDEINLLYVAATRAKKHLTLNAQLAQLLAYRQGRATAPTVSMTVRPVTGEGAFRDQLGKIAGKQVEAEEAEIAAIEGSHD